MLGVATAVAVLAGALLVGDSVRGSLRDIALGRLGHTDQVLSSMGFFREALSDDVSGARSEREPPRRSSSPTRSSRSSRLGVARRR